MDEGDLQLILLARALSTWPS